MSQVLYLRFLRVFVAGALAQMGLMASTGKLDDFNSWLTAVIVAGLTGGFAALDKYLRYEDDPQV